MINSGNQFIDRSSYDEQRFYDVCTCIIKNRNLSYKELTEKLRYYHASNPDSLNQLFDKYKYLSPKLIKASKTVIQYMKQKQRGKITEEVESAFNKIGDVKIERNSNYQNSKPGKGFNFYSNTTTVKEGKQQRLEIAKSYLEEIKKGKTIEEIASENNKLEGTIKTYINKNLALSPEDFVDYKIIVNSIERIDQTELNQIKEVVEFFINNLEKSINKLEKEKLKADKKKELKDRIVFLNRLLRTYNKILECLNYKCTVNAKELRDIEEFIVEYAVYISNITKTYNGLKTDNTSDENQQKIYEIYKEKVNL